MMDDSECHTIEAYKATNQSSQCSIVIDDEEDEGAMPIDQDPLPQPPPPKPPMDAMLLKDIKSDVMYIHSIVASYGKEDRIKYRCAMIIRENKETLTDEKKVQIWKTAMLAARPVKQRYKGYPEIYLHFEISTCYDENSDCEYEDNEWDDGFAWILPNGLLILSADRCDKLIRIIKAMKKIVFSQSRYAYLPCVYQYIAEYNKYYMGTSIDQKKLAAAINAKSNVLVADFTLKTCSDCKTSVSSRYPYIMEYNGSGFTLDPAYKSKIFSMTVHDDRMQWLMHMETDDTDPDYINDQFTRQHNLMAGIVLKCFCY